jgi:hypothetical protein
MRATRAAAIRQYARSRGATGFLDVAFGRCRDCDARRISERVAEAAKGARRVGALVSPRARYDVFTKKEGTGLRPLRLIIGQGPDGAQEILAADHRPPASAPPPYMGELELYELEEEVKAMNAKLTWTDAPKTSAYIDSNWPYGERHHLLYIPVDIDGKLLKVGETTQQMRGRYPGDRIQAGGKTATAAQYWIAKVEVEDTRKGKQGQWIPAQKDQMQDVEYLVARRLSRGRLELPLHRTRKKGVDVLPLKAIGRVNLEDVLPKPLHGGHPDNPKEKSVLRARSTNDIVMSPGNLYEQ